MAGSESHRVGSALSSPWSPRAVHARCSLFTSEMRFSLAAAPETLGGRGPGRGRRLRRRQRPARMRGRARRGLFDRAHCPLAFVDVCFAWLVGAAAVGGASNRSITRCHVSRRDRPRFLRHIWRKPPSSFEKYRCQRLSKHGVRYRPARFLGDYSSHT